MRRRNPPHGVILQKGWLDSAQCDELVAYLEEQPRQRLVTFDGHTGQQQYDRDRVTDWVPLGSQQPTIIENVQTALREVAEPKFECRINWFLMPQVLRYESGGHYIRHADSEQMNPDNNTWHKVADRDVSLLMYLNDEFAGGELFFPNFNYRYQPEKGDLVLFPSDHRYMHEAETVTSGFRYAIVSWAAKVGEPSVQDAIPDGAIFMNEDEKN